MQSFLVTQRSNCRASRTHGTVWSVARGYPVAAPLPSHRNKKRRAMPYASPTADIQFVLDHVTGFERVQATERFAEATPETCAAVLVEGGRICNEVLAPLNRVGDLNPAVLENGIVRTSTGFDGGYEALATGGWIGLSSEPEYGGMGLPMALNTAMNEMMSGSCLALQLATLLSQGQIEALEHHATDALKDLYLPKLISGEWNATMNLTEPQAGSDVGALRSKAEPQSDGTYAVTGQKIYISWGDCDFTDNTIHLVLARLPDAPEGTRGVSLFLVPKRLPDANGNAGARNSVRVVSLEHKMGLHGSPTAVMEFSGATGWMIGNAGGGIKAMFTMMNNARLGVAAQGVGVAEAATQAALAFARDRIQGPPLRRSSGAISDHADVRRMLMSMRADTFAARAMALDCAVAIDMANATGDAKWSARVGVLTPLAKSFCTDTGVAVASEAIQVHGGMGFIEETGVAQYLRDVRVTTIYEGTNGIQAMDLVGRKLGDGGEAVLLLIDAIEAEAEAARATQPALAEPIWQAAETLREATEAMLAEDDLNIRFAGAVPYQRAFARVLGGMYHLRAAMAEGGIGPRSALASVYILRLLPEHAALLAATSAGDTGLYDDDLFGSAA
jgi:acyl-CoA dehydrogenase